MTTPVKDKRFFLTQKPPEGYIAGIGRGAIGFTTRSDIGNARNTEAPSGVPGFRGKTAPTASKFQRKDNGNTTSTEEDDDNDDDETQGNGKFDEFNGDQTDSFQDQNAQYDQEDEEADLIWESIDRKMDSRRKTKRELHEKEERERMEKSTPKIQEQLSDVSEQLSTMTEEEWSSIPDSGDYSKKNKLMKKKYDFFTPIPDSLIEKAKQENETTTILNTRHQGGTESTDLTHVSSARTDLLKMQLNRVSDSVSGKTCVDPKGYLTEMNSIHIASDAEIGDMKRTRLLFKSVVTTNPKFYPGWLNAAKLEVLDGDIAEARKIIEQACISCPDSEEVWIENAKLQTPEKAKYILGQAIKILPHSVKIWLYAMNLEKQVKIKKKIIKRALEFIPTSVKLWKEAVELEEDPDDARILLGRACECVTDNVELWLALANLESHQRAREVLNKARTEIPSSPEIWIAAAQLEESQGNREIVQKIIKKAIKSLSVDLQVMDREKWLAEAEKAEKAGFIVTCQAIVFETISMGIDEDERKRIWLLDAEEAVQKGSIKMANAIYAHILTVFPGKKSVWFKVAQLEKQYGTKEALDATLQKAITNCPNYELFWLMRAKEKWIHGQAQESREILAAAFKLNSNSEEIWLAAVKIESELNDIKVARALLTKARDSASTKRIWMKSAMLERDFGKDETAELQLIDKGLAKFPDFYKLWLMKAQLLERQKKAVEVVRSVYSQAQSKCPHEVPVWIESARFEIRNQQINRARSQLEVCRNKNPKSQDIYLELSRFELKYNSSPQIASQLSQKYLAMGLQECGNEHGGKLWSEIIANEPSHSKKNRCVDALNKCNNDPNVLLQVSIVFWKEGKLEKAREWFQKLVGKFPEFGDGFAFYYCYLLKTSSSSNSETPECIELIKKCQESEPRYGEHWIKVSKALGNSKLKSDQILKQVSFTILKDHILK
ncbi:TPR repeat-containing protein [Tieghemostelium lacteum]|uniref:TPR repeat-containing protein n=1 Tax=Tieghemostelium lacteum TaxID=361077 RepID=A0A151Z727_TIELA|nr:TPR repeat-containing protein [Tieghemostelium lacteum]|eukprot:KYQ89763.1 TPR repeat-containing protein [Tieghemostelium lacteum]